MSENINVWPPFPTIADVIDSGIPLLCIESSGAFLYVHTENLSELKRWQKYLYDKFQFYTADDFTISGVVGYHARLINNNFPLRLPRIKVITRDRTKWLLK